MLKEKYKKEGKNRMRYRVIAYPVNENLPIHLLLNASRHTRDVYFGLLSIYISNKGERGGRTGLHIRHQNSHLEHYTDIIYSFGQTFMHKTLV